MSASVTHYQIHWSVDTQSGYVHLALDGALDWFSIPVNSPSQITAINSILENNAVCFDVKTQTFGFEKPHPTQSAGCFEGVDLPSPFM